MFWPRLRARTTETSKKPGAAETRHPGFFSAIPIVLHGDMDLSSHYTNYGIIFEIVSTKFSELSWFYPGQIKTSLYNANKTGCHYKKVSR
jgi:hypothetical protein